MYSAEYRTIQNNINKKTKGKKAFHICVCVRNDRSLCVFMSRRELSEC